MSRPAITFELGVADAEQARIFYTAVLGWKMEPSPSGEGFVIDANGVSGGLHPDDPGASPYVFFAVDDLDAAVGRIRERGGDVENVGERDAESVERFGRFRLCRDDQGSTFGLHEPPSASA